MPTYIFVLTSILLNLILGFMVQWKNYRPTFRLLVLFLSLLVPLFLIPTHLAASQPVAEYMPALFRLGLCLYVLISLGIMELTGRFLRNPEEGGAFNLGSWNVSYFRLVGIGVAAALATGFVFGGTAVVIQEEATLFFTDAGILIPISALLASIYGLYVLENTYRFAAGYQKKIGRLGFLSLTAMALFQVVFFSRVVVYRSLTLPLLVESTVVVGIAFPVLLAGFLRYRLGSEQISIPREAVYTSATIFLTGAAFLGVALTIGVFRWLELDFTHFENFLLGFSLCFLAVLMVGSGSMRRRLSRFLNQRIYSRKYDYQEQFFRLHRTMMSGNDLEAAMTDLVENMKYSVAVDDAYVFIINWQDGNYYLHENKEESTETGLVLSGDSSLARAFMGRQESLDLLSPGERDRILGAALKEDEMVAKLSIDAVFPILQADRLVGLLCLRGSRTAGLDGEDVALICAFANSIGNALFRNKVLRERIERKQFESFHHVASFIIHDIKNQIATLSLLLRNAQRNMDNPSFRTSMLTSIQSCSENLQKLIDKLAVSRGEQDMSLEPHSAGEVLEEVVANSGLKALDGLVLEFRREDEGSAPMDRSALFFAVKNLVTNALEAMKNQGTLRIRTGNLGPTVPDRLKQLFGGGDQFFSGFSVYILVEDTGAGMSDGFMKEKLFHPFSTTKEKGIGIGLYQSKALVEKMGGKLLCHSVAGEGTEFCILL